MRLGWDAEFHHDPNQGRVGGPRSEWSVPPRQRLSRSVSRADGTHGDTPENSDPMGGGDPRLWRPREELGGIGRVNVRDWPMQWGARTYGLQGARPRWMPPDRLGGGATALVEDLADAAAPCGEPGACGRQIRGPESKSVVIYNTELGWMIKTKSR
jgi:hypothetical protein